MNAQLKTQSWHGLTSQVSYTWSKQMDTLFGRKWTEQACSPSAGSGIPSGLMARRIRTIPIALWRPWTYELPGPKLGKSFPARGGRRLATKCDHDLRNRRPVTVFNGYTSSFDSMGDVPDQDCNANIAGGERSFTHYFNTDCYVEPPARTALSWSRCNRLRDSIAATKPATTCTILESIIGICQSGKSFTLVRRGTRTPAPGRVVQHFQPHPVVKRHQSRLQMRRTMTAK